MALTSGRRRLCLSDGDLEVTSSVCNFLYSFAPVIRNMVRRNRRRFFFCFLAFLAEMFLNSGADLFRLFLKQSTNPPPSNVPFFKPRSADFFAVLVFLKFGANFFSCFL